MVANEADTAYDVVEFPLSTVGVIWEITLTRSDAIHFNVEGMAFFEVVREGFVTQVFGDTFVGIRESAFG